MTKAYTHIGGDATKTYTETDKREEAVYDSAMAGAQR